MPILQIEGVGEVEIDQGFTRLTPEQQNATVDEIVAQVRGGAGPMPTPVAGGPEVPLYGPNDELLQRGAPPAPAPKPEPGVTAAAGRVAGRAGEAAAERFGERPLGLSDETIQDLRTKGVLTPEGRAPTPLQLLNEVVVRFGAQAGDAILRTIGAGIGGISGAVGQTARETGLAKDDMAKRLERDVGGLIETAGIVSGAPGPATQQAAARGVATTLRAGAQDAAAARAAGPAAAATTSEEFKGVSRGFYKQMEDAGVVIQPASMKTLATDTFSVASKAGLDEVLTKNSLAAVNRIEKLADPKTGPVSFESLDRARQVASDAATKAIIEAKGKTTNDVRIAELIINKIDDFVDGMKAADVVVGDVKVAAPAVAQARDLWSRAAKLDTIERLVRRAEESASQFRGSGFENALVTQFRQLSKNDAAMKRFSPDEQDAIRMVNRGSGPAKIARATGSLAARGPVSALSGAGVGGTIGSALLGPGIGTIAGAGAQFGLGEIGRKVATAIARRAVGRLEEVIRTGGKTPFASSALKRGTAMITRLGAPPAAGEAAGRSAQNRQPTQPENPASYGNVVGALEGARNTLGGPPTIGGALNQAMAAVPGGPVFTGAAKAAAKALTEALHKDAGAGFPALVDQLRALPVAELKAIAKEFSGLSASSATDAIKKIYQRFNAMEQHRAKQRATGGRSAG